jgi:aminocarboxymuconate-semialdehyde decarboxylase
MRVIDCQCHWHARAYFEALLDRTAFPRAERSDEGYVFHPIEGRSFPVEASYCDLEPQLEHMEAEGVDVLVSSMGAFTVDALRVEEAIELALRVNEERAEAEKRYPGRFYALATIPMQDERAAIEVLDDATGRLGLRGVCLPSNVNGEPIASEAKHAVYSRIAELGVPLFLHPTRTIMETKLRRYGHEYSVGFMVDSSIAALDLVFSGVLDACPDLEVVHPHLGGVLPDLAERVDVEYAKPWALGRKLERPPSEYLRERFYTDTISFNRSALALARDFYGLDKLLYASDYPYWPPREGVDFLRDNLAADELEPVLNGNAARLLDLP